MRRLWRAAGLTIAAECDVPGFSHRTESTPADVILTTATAPAWDASSDWHSYHLGSETNDAGVPLVRVARCDAGFRFHYSDDTRFWIDARGRDVWMTWESTFEDACTYLVGPIIGFLLRVRGEVALHASAVQIGSAAVAFVGPHACGKSTTAAALGRRGHPVVTDDVSRVTRSEGGWFIHPFGGALRLWPEAEAMVFGGRGHLEPITASWDKLGLEMGRHGVHAAAQPLPLAALAFLEADATAAVAPLTSAEAMRRLVVNGSASYLLDAVGREAEFMPMAALARDIPSATISRDAATNFDAFLDRILEWATRCVARVVAA